MKLISRMLLAAMILMAGQLVRADQLLQTTLCTNDSSSYSSVVYQGQSCTAITTKMHCGSVENRRESYLFVSPTAVVSLYSRSR